MNKVNSTTKTDKRNAILTGVFFIMATVTAIIGLKLYDPILIHSDYLVQGARHSDQIVLGTVFELILACVNIGTGIMLFPYLRKFNVSMGLGYVCFRLLEVVFILVGIVSVLSLLSLSQEFTNATAPNVAYFETIGKTLKAIHAWTFLLGPNFMLGVNTFLYSYIFYRSKLVPVKISTIGIAGAILILTAALLQMFGIIQQLSQLHILLSIPIALYEMILAVWLIVKGFNRKADEPIQK